MNMRRAALIPLLFATWMLSAQPSSAARQDDVSAIYSVLIHGSSFQALGQRSGQCWGVVNQTINIDDMNPALAPDAALKPPSYDPKPFEEALADYNVRKYQRQTITHISHSSSNPLLSAQEAADFRASRTGISGGSGSGRSANCGGITYFSDVYFSTHRNAALVYMLNWSGSLSSHGEWIYLEKQSKDWVQRSGQAAITSGAKPF